MDLISSFSTALSAEGKSQNTAVTYIVAVRQFLKFHNNSLSSITQESVDAFCSKFNARNQTQNLKKNAVSKFLTFLFERGHIKKQFKIRTKSIRISEPEYLTITEQGRLFNVLQSDEKYYRDFVLFATMLYTGMRISETLNLKKSDIRDDYLVIRESKTGAGKVYIREKLFPILDEYLSSQKIGQSDYLFKSRQSKRISERMVQLLIKKYLRLAGINKELTPHGLRHTFAARLRQSGSDIEIIQRSLRHGHIQSSTRYTHISDSNLQGAIEKSVNMPKK